jgi:hypothetical protein
MIFTRKNQVHSEVNASRRNIQPQPVLYRPLPNPLTIKQTPKSISKSDEPRKMLWGEPTWYFFHTMAEKIKPEMYAQHRGEILNIINTVCNLLPCPVCSGHAREYLNKINFNAIQTKEDLKMLLFTFHNTVNERKGYPLFTVEMLNEKYQRANFVNIIGRFLQVFEDRPLSGFKQINDNFHRARAAKSLREWLTKNLNIFNLNSM